MLRRVVAVLSVLSSLGCLSDVVFAQAQNRQQQQAPKPTPVTVDAKVDQVVAQGILASDKDGKKYAIGFDDKSKIGLSGETAFENVKIGSFVQFEVNLDGKGVPTEEVKKIQVTQQSDTVTPGIQPSKGPDYKEGEPDLFFVRGTVRKNANGELSVVAEKKTVTVKVAKGVMVPVTIADWRMAKPGDTIKGSGETFPQANANGPSLVRGTIMTITAAAPIDGKKGGK